MFALFGVVCLLRQRCVSGGRFPCGLALGSHLVVLSTTGTPRGLTAADVSCHLGLTADWLRNGYLSVLLGLTSPLYRGSIGLLGLTKRQASFGFHDQARAPLLYALALYVELLRAA
jgi:hypothetical protein